MVEKSTRQSANSTYCNYSFENIQMQGSNYRVPVLNKGNRGKVIEKKGQQVAEDKSQRQGGQNDKRSTENREEVNYTHFVSVPIKDPVIRRNFDNFKQTILKDKSLGVQMKQFTETPSLHLTILMLDLKDEARFNAAKTVLSGLERNIMEDLLGATGGQDPSPVELTF